jgi:hypothetical protein
MDGKQKLLSVDSLSGIILPTIVGTDVQKSFVFPSLPLLFMILLNMMR